MGQLPVTIKRVEFTNFKAFSRFSVSLQHMNVFVGPNNAGKSTLLGAFRVLAAGIQKANRRRSDWTEPQSLLPGYLLSEEQVPIALENVRTDYAESPTMVRFELSNGFSLRLSFFGDRTCALIPDAMGKAIRDTKAFNRFFPVTIGVIPQLGPVEHEEQLLDRDYVRRGLSTHRASRHFRNFWLHFPEDFDSWRERVRATWPGMDVEPPELIQTAERPTVAMFVRENRISRELYWSGSGFQVWCQILTHIEKARGCSFLLVDEPEIYLHPEVQRQLLAMLRDAGPDILLATHSAEIIEEAEPHEVLLIDKRRRSAKRVSNVGGLSSALKSIGSIRTTSLPQIARTNRVLFVEGDDDFKLLSAFARRLGFLRLAAHADLALWPMGGFPSVEKLKATCAAVRSAFNADVRFAGVFDRDFRCDDEVNEFSLEFRELGEIEILARKEIENYLLVPSVLDRAILRAHGVRAALLETSLPVPVSAESMLDEITTALRWDIQPVAITRAVQYLRELRGRHDDEVTITRTVSKAFEARWADLGERLTLVPGKRVLRQLNQRLQAEYQIQLTPRTIADTFHAAEIPADLSRLLRRLDRFRDKAFSAATDVEEG